MPGSLTNPNITRSRLMLEIASELVGGRTNNLGHARRPLGDWQRLAGNEKHARAESAFPHGHLAEVIVLSDDDPLLRCSDGGDVHVSGGRLRFGDVDDVVPRRAERVCDRPGAAFVD